MSKPSNVLKLQINSNKSLLKQLYVFFQLRVGELVAKGVVKRLLQFVVPFILSLLTSLGLFGCSELFK